MPMIAKLTPKKGRWTRLPGKIKRQRAKLEVAATYKDAVDRVRGFHNSRGPASRCVRIDPKTVKIDP